MTIDHTPPNEEECSPHNNSNTTKLPLYIVIAYRYGNRHGHHYPIGVFQNKEQAIKEAQDYHYFRGSKYEHIILEIEDFGFNDDLKEVWKSNGMK